MDESFAPFSADLTTALAFAREAVLARPEPGLDMEEVAANVARDIRAGRAQGGLWMRAGRPVGLVLWTPSGPLGAAVRLMYLTSDVASPETYRALFDAIVRSAGVVAFVASLPGLGPKEESNLLGSLGFARFSRSEMRFPPEKAVPALDLPEGITIRAARPEDETELARVHAAAYRDHFDRYLFLEDLDPTSDAEKIVHSLFHGRWGELLGGASVVAEAGGRLVAGTLVLRAAERALIADVSVDPSQQGRGVGRAVLVATVAALRARGERAIALAVTEENGRARRLYERVGFVRALGPTHEWYNTRVIPTAPGTD